MKKLAILLVLLIASICSLAYAKDDKKSGDADRKSGHSSEVQRERGRNNPPQNDNRSPGANRGDNSSSRREQERNRPSNPPAADTSQNRPNDDSSQARRQDDNRPNSPPASDRDRENNSLRTRRNEGDRPNNPPPADNARRQEQDKRSDNQKEQERTRAEERDRRENRSNSSSNRPSVNEKRYGDHNNDRRVNSRRDLFGDRRPVQFRREPRRQRIEVFVDNHHYGHRSYWSPSRRYRTEDFCIFLATVVILAAEEERLTPDEIAIRHNTYFEYRDQCLEAFMPYYDNVIYNYRPGDDWPECIPTFTYYGDLRVRLGWNSEFRCFGFSDPFNQDSFIEYFWWQDDAMADRLMHLHYYRWKYSVRL